jgi:hypothetical protein
MSVRSNFIPGGRNANDFEELKGQLLQSDEDIES